LSQSEAVLYKRNSTAEEKALKEQRIQLKYILNKLYKDLGILTYGNDKFIEESMRQNGKMFSGRRSSGSVVDDEMVVDTRSAVGEKNIVNDVPVLQDVHDASEFDDEDEEVTKPTDRDLRGQNRSLRKQLAEQTRLIEELMCAREEELVKSSTDASASASASASADENMVIVIDDDEESSKDAVVESSVVTSAQRRVAQRARATVNDRVYTPESLAVYHLKLIYYYHRPGDIVFDAFKGKGIYFNNFTDIFGAGHYVWCEIDEGKDFFDFKDRVDIIVTNPPFSKFDEIFAHAVTLHPRIISFIMGVINLSPKRVSFLESYDYGLREVHFFRVQGWIFINAIVVFEKGYIGPAVSVFLPQVFKH